jgi:hypothetical protein
MTYPPAVRACLWSYDISALDLERDATLIITNVLNYGTKEATRWLFAEYTAKQIATVVQKPLPGRWDKRSLALWALLFGVTPEITGRFSTAYALRNIG